MATLGELEAHSHLERYDPNLPIHVLEHRYIYFSPSAFQYVTNTLPKRKAHWGSRRMTPSEQLFGCLSDFCRGAPMNYGSEFKTLDPRSDGTCAWIWELKTEDLRIFGWFVSMDIFIASEVVVANLLKQTNAYQTYVNRAARFRDALDLDPPKCLETLEPADVISNQD